MRSAPVQPRCGGVYERLVKVVVAVPLQELSRNARTVDQRTDELRHAPRKCGARVGNAVPERIAEPYLDIDLALFPKPGELLREGDDEPVYVRPRYVFEMAPELQPRIQGFLHYGKVILHRLLPALVQLEKDVVVAAGGQNPGFLESHALHELQIIFVRTYPSGDFRILVSEREHVFHRFSVLVAVEKKLRVPDDPLGPSQLVKELVQIDDLFR